MYIGTYSSVNDGCSAEQLDGRDRPFRPAAAANLIAAWLVHAYTATGAIAAFLGTVAVFEARYRDSFSG